ncbi:MAG: hypothetical protein JNM63_09860, partial [Spirochaetia bacterium]|nr:hypothetical protein [Spirochaetia bacterium]
MSVDNDIIAELERMTGIEVIHRSKRTEPLRADMKWDGETVSLSCETPVRTALRATRAEVWANEVDGNPAITCASYGKGKIITSFLP